MQHTAMGFYVNKQSQQHQKQLLEGAKNNKCLSPTRTPLRIPVPRITPSPTPRATKSACYYHLPLSTPSRSSHFTAGTPDRFIPNRSRMDMSLVRASLQQQQVSPRRSQSSQTITTKGSAAGNLEYQRQLREVFWGSSAHPNQIMKFGSNGRAGRRKQTSEIQSVSQKRSNDDNPYRHDILRHSNYHRHYTSANGIHRSILGNSRSHRGIPTIERVFALEAPEVLLDDDLNLISFGPSLAVALDDRLYLWNNGNVQLFTCTEDGKSISCVQWSRRHNHNHHGGSSDVFHTASQRNNHTPNRPVLLALGREESVEVWSVEEGGCLCEFFDHKGYVTAICWDDTGRELLAASMAGIKRYNIAEASRSSDDDEQATVIHYKDTGGEQDGERITCLRWNDNRIVSAGNGVIHVWDANQRGDNIRPIRTMVHPGVRCLEFCPSRGNVLVSGGKGGLKFWNVQNGSLRAVIGTESDVTGIVWSCQNELLAAHGEQLSLWKVDSTPTKITEINTRGGKVLSMDRSSDGRIACIHEDEILTGYNITGTSKMARHSGTGNRLKPSVLDVPLIR